MEFTKLSPNKEWQNEIYNINRIGKYVGLDIEKYKERKILKDYLYLANQGKPIASSIPEIIYEAKKYLEKFNKFQWVGIATIFIMVLFSFYTIWQLFYEVRPLVIGTTNYIQNIPTKNNDIQNNLQRETELLKNRITTLEVKLDSLNINKK